MRLMCNSLKWRFLTVSYDSFLGGSPPSPLPTKKRRMQSPDCILYLISLICNCFKSNLVVLKCEHSPPKKKKKEKENRKSKRKRNICYNIKKKGIYMIFMLKNFLKIVVKIKESINLHKHYIRHKRHKPLRSIIFQSL